MADFIFASPAFVAFVLIWWHYREVIGRRTEWFVSEAFIGAVHHRCLLVSTAQTYDPLSDQLVDQRLMHAPSNHLSTS